MNYAHTELNGETAAAVTKYQKRNFAKDNVDDERARDTKKNAFMNFKCHKCGRK